MATVFRLPDIGEGLTEAEIMEWHYAVGDEVRADQPLVSVETDKAQVELPAPVSGVLLHRGAEAGTVLPVGQVLAVIGIRGERWSGGSTDEEPPVETDQESFDLTPPGPVPERPPLVGTLIDEAEDLATPPPEPQPRVVEPQPAPTAGPGSAPSGTTAQGSTRPRALPLVRREAAARGIDLTSVTGSGPGGRILRSDLDAVGTEPASRPAPPAGSHPPAEREDPSGGAPLDGGGDLSEGSPQEGTPLSATRRAIARNLTESWRTIPHVTTFGRFDASRLLDVRRSLSERHGRPIPLDALLVAASLPVLAAHPDLNATLADDHLVHHDGVDMGVAIDGPAGLLVGVVHRADELRLLDIADRIAALADGARERTLGPDDLRGQTFTVSNIGAVGGGMGTPIIPLGTSGILSVGRAEDTPIARSGQVVIAPMAPLSLSYDHRVIDGAQGRAIMAMLVENLEEPALFLV
jgi:pyruvate dehydrogenase E2 component (dihydrolipoamide acetyltransferase)